MPKFSADELEEIRLNTERIESQRKSKSHKKDHDPDDEDDDSDDDDHHRGKSKKKKKKKTRRKKKSKDHSLQERMIAVILLGITILISYLMMIFYR